MGLRVVSRHGAVLRLEVPSPRTKKKFGMRTTGPPAKWPLEPICMKDAEGWGGVGQPRRVRVVECLGERGGW